MSDCRVTFRQPHRHTPTYSDVAQKIFPLTATVAIAFAGDVNAAALLLCELHRQLKRRRRFDTASLLQWLPRFMKNAYGRIRFKGQKAPVIEFIVAATIPSRDNVVERARVADILRRAVSPEATMQRNWMPDVVMRVMMTPAEATHVSIPGAPAVVLGRMRSPHFSLRTVPALTCLAIGSGGRAVVEMERAADWLFASDSDLMVQMGLESAVEDFVVQNDIDSVGGMYPCIKLDRRGLAMLSGSRGLPQHEIALTYDAKTGRWAQENRATGKKQLLLRPWEIMASLPNGNNRFDDYRNAIQQFNPRRGKRPTA